MNFHHTIWTAPSVALIIAGAAFAQQAGSLRGSVVDREFEAPVAGAVVTLVETGARATTNELGTYVFSAVAAGRYTVIITKDGFVRQVKQDVLVTDGVLADLDVELAGEFQDMDEFVVQEVELGGSEAALLTLRSSSPQLIDSVGADIMAKAGASDAAAALLLVPGASVQEGRYAVVRGLPDRYVSAQLDGVRLPTSDAERRAVQLDQFPSAVIQSIQVSKTFMPDQQGDASGGAVNIDLKDIPDETSFQLRSQAGYNSQVRRAGSSFLSSEGSGVNFWGNDDGRGIPDLPEGSSWPNAVGTQTGSAAELDSKWSASGGGKWEIDEGVKVGGFGSFFYERESSYFDNGVEDSWWITPNEGVVPQYGQGAPSQLAFQSSLLDVTQGSQSVQWGTLASVGIETERNTLGATYLYSRTAVDTSTLATNTRGKQFFCGPDYDWSSIGLPTLEPYDVNDPGSIANTTLLFASPYQRLETLEYTETSTESTILKGTHKLSDEDGELFLVPIIDWTLSQSTATYDQPDKTQFASIWLPPSNEIDPSLPGIWLPYAPAENINLGWVQHIWQSVEESSEQISINLKLPFKTTDDREGYVKGGVFNDDVHRTYTQDTYSNRLSDPNTFYIGGWEDPWSAVFPEEKHPIYESTLDVDYNGTQRIGAFYMMADLPIGEEWNIMGGLRLESTHLTTTVFGEADAVWFPPGALVPIDFANDPDAANVDFQDDNALPAISTQWAVSEEVMLRASFAQTIARQTFREITPVLQQEFLGGPIFIGNPELTMSSLNNYDLRADYTPYEGWLISASLFSKTLVDTIEYSQFEAPQGFVYTAPVNYPEGEIFGLEFETRIKAGDINENFQGLTLGFNMTVLKSEVTLPKSEQESFEQIGFPITTRDMSGTPAFLMNANVAYEFEELGTQVALFYTVTGDTLETGAGVDSGNFVPSIYALSYGTLNFTLGQKLGEYFKLSFQAKNILNPEIQTVYRSEYLPDDILSTSYTAGVDYTVGLSFRMEF